MSNKNRRRARKKTTSASSSGKELSQNPSHGEEQDHVDDQSASAKTKHIVQHWDNFFKLIAGIAFVAWMIQEWWLPHNKIFLLIAIICGLADVFYVLANKFLPSRLYFAIPLWVVFLGMVIFVARHQGIAPVAIPVLAPAEPEFPGFDVNITRYTVDFPSMAPISFTPKDLETPKVLDGFVNGIKPVTMYTIDGHLYVDVIIWKNSGVDDISIKRNKLSGTPDGWDVNSNSRAFEVVDSSLLPMFQLIYKSTSEIELRGIFIYGGFGLTSVDANGRMSPMAFYSVPVDLHSPLGGHYFGMSSYPPTPQVRAIYEQANPRIFKYPSYKYPGVTAD